MSRYLLGKVTELHYRPDIDGLRALAVLSVIFYHAGFVAFKGGFVGVDVFFVISGYLITRIIASEVQKGTFSFANFYLRRARRLFPALFVTLAGSLVVGGLILVPSHLANFAQSLIFSIVPAANILFWKDTGYFSSAAIVKPLLNMWSLAVEEQFYLIWPSLLIALFTLRRSWLSLTILLAVGIGSLAYAEVKLAAHPSEVFFLTQYRAFEFIAGVLCVWLVNHRPKSAFACEISLAVGLAMIAYAVFTYSRNMAFPGLNVIPPVIGAMLVIYAGSPHYLGRLLSNRVAVGVGLISYSLYLVHWPLLVFLTYVAGTEKWFIPYIVVIVSFILATLMYFYVETPFRKPKETSIAYQGKSFVLISVILAIALILISLSAWNSNGWLWRYPSELRYLPEETVTEKDQRSSIYDHLCESRAWGQCSYFSKIQGIKNVLIIGDSHAIDALNALYSINQKPNYILHSLGGCPPLVKQDYKLLTPQFPERMTCFKMNNVRFDRRVLEKADLIVINVQFGWYKPVHLERAINAIRSKTAAPIWVLGNYIQLKQDLPNLIFQHPHDLILKEWFGDQTYIYEASLRNLSHKLGFFFISKKALLCPDSEIKDCPIRLDDGKLFTYDSHHLSLSAAKLLGEKLQLTFPKIIECGLSRQCAP